MDVPDREVDKDHVGAFIAGASKVALGHATEIGIPATISVLSRDRTVLVLLPPTPPTHPPSLPRCDRRRPLAGPVSPLSTPPHRRCPSPPPANDPLASPFRRPPPRHRRRAAEILAQRDQRAAAVHARRKGHKMSRRLPQLVATQSGPACETVVIPMPACRGQGADAPAKPASPGPPQGFTGSTDGISTAGIATSTGQLSSSRSLPKLPNSCPHRRNPRRSSPREPPTACRPGNTPRSHRRAAAPPPSASPDLQRPEPGIGPEHIAVRHQH